jgi:hypothetical protein
MVICSCQFTENELCTSSNHLSFPSFTPTCLKISMCNPSVAHSHVYIHSPSARTEQPNITYWSLIFLLSWSALKHFSFFHSSVSSYLVLITWRTATSHFYVPLCKSQDCVFFPTMFKFWRYCRSTVFISQPWTSITECNSWKPEVFLDVTLSYWAWFQTLWGTAMPPKCEELLCQWHSIIFHKTLIFNNTVVRTSNFTCLTSCCVPLF